MFRARSVLVAAALLLLSGVLGPCSTTAAAGETLVYTVDHSFSESEPFTRRGTLEIVSKHRGKLQQQPEDSWKEKLYASAVNGGTYRVRITSEDTSTGKRVVAQSFTSACALYNSGFSDTFTLFLSKEKKFVTAVSQSVPLGCPATLEKKASLSFKNSVSIAQMASGPEPMTKKFVEEKKAKEEEEKANPDGNKSFLEKYWVYIAIFVGMQVLSAVFQPKQAGAAK